MPRATDVDAIMQGLNALTTGFQYGQERREKKALLDEEKEYRDKKFSSDEKEREAERLFREKQFADTIAQKKLDAQDKYDMFSMGLDERIKNNEQNFLIKQSQYNLEALAYERDGRMDEAKALREQNKIEQQWFAEEQKIIQEFKDNPNLLAQGLSNLYTARNPGAKAEDISAFIDPYLKEAKILESYRKQKEDAELEEKRLKSKPSITRDIGLNDEGENVVFGTKITGKDAKGIAAAEAELMKMQGKKGEPEVDDTEKKYNEIIKSPTINLEEMMKDAGYMKAKERSKSSNEEERQLGLNYLIELGKKYGGKEKGWFGY